MRIIALYAITCLIFLAVDAVMLASYMAPLFREHIGHLMATPMRGLPAVLFYLGYVGAVLYLASMPAMKAGRPSKAIVPAAILGAAAYGTFEFTNYAIIADWHIQMVVSDTIWGAILTGGSAWAALALVQRFSK